MMQAPCLETKRLLLQALDLRDAPAVYVYRSHPAVFRYQSWRPSSVEEVAEFIADMRRAGFRVADRWFQLGLYLKASRELIGDVGLRFLPPDAQQVEIGFTVSPAHQRRGYAAEALEALFAYVFRSLQLHRITASVDPRNAASVGLLEKIGMRKEAHHRQSIWTAQGWCDDVIYAVLREEWGDGAARVAAKGAQP